MSTEVEVLDDDVLVQVVESPHVIVSSEVVTEVIAVGPQGPQGPPGETGPQGPQGPQGEKGDIGGVYLHLQNTPSTTWTIQHDLGYYPNVTVIDSAGTTVIGDVTYDSLNQVTISFASAFSGRATLS